MPSLSAGLSFANDKRSTGWRSRPGHGMASQISPVRNSPSSRRIFPTSHLLEILRDGRVRNLPAEKPAEEPVEIPPVSPDSNVIAFPGTVTWPVVSRPVPPRVRRISRGPHGDGGGTPPSAAASAAPALALADSQPVFVADQGDKPQIVREPAEEAAPQRVLFRESLRLLLTAGRRDVALSLAKSPDRLSMTQLAQMIVHLRRQVAASQSEGPSTTGVPSDHARATLGLTTPGSGAPSIVQLLK